MRLGLFIPTADTYPCKDHHGGVWDADHGPDAALAKLLCRPCPIRHDCLDHAMRMERGQTRPFRGGVWGGLGPEERARLDKAGLA